MEFAGEPPAERKQDSAERSVGKNGQELEKLPDLDLQLPAYVNRFEWCKERERERLF